MKSPKFPSHFLFGAATAAYQAEGAISTGGKVPTAWDEYFATSKQIDPNLASQFYYKYLEDIKLAQKFGIKALRISIAWSRIFLNDSLEVNLEGVAFYHRVIDACLMHKIVPFVTLHHFDTPLHWHKKGDWLCPNMIEAFVSFASFCFEEYGYKIKHWITINEPWSIVAGQYIIGHFPPNIKYNLNSAVHALHNMMIAHGRVVKAYKELDLGGEIGIVHILESKYPLTNNIKDIAAAKKEHILANQFLLDATFNGTYGEETLTFIQEILSLNSGHFSVSSEDIAILEYGAKNTDFLGINYYASHFLQCYSGDNCIIHNGTGTKGTSCFALKGVGKRVTNPHIPTTDWDWPIYPQGLLDMIRHVFQTYQMGKKVYITENGYGAKEVLAENENMISDDGRIDYIRQHLLAIHTAIGEGFPVDGYFIWSLFDMFSWTNGYNKRYGLFYIDFPTGKRTPKKSAYWYEQVSRTGILV